MYSEIKSKENSSIISRKEFINKIIKGISVLTLGTLSVSYFNACSEETNPVEPSQNNNNSNTLTIDISKPEYKVLNNTGGTVAIAGNAFDSNGLLIIRASQNSVKAFSRTCTHQGCTVSNFQNGISTCPCHGSQFNTSGNAVRGPATQSLKSYTASLSGSIITISK